MNRVPVVAVAGDACIDWLSIPIESVAEQAGEPNWRLRGGSHMFAVRGGAWLTADLLAAAMGPEATVVPPPSVGPLENVPPDQILHSLIRLKASGRAVWRVASFDGYAGPLRRNEQKAAPPFPAGTPADVVVLDDAGNGCRNDPATWPAEVKAPARKPLVVLKARRPLMEGELWKHVHDHHAARTVVVLTADELRATGGRIGRGLSWERAAFETWTALAHGPQFQPLLACAWIVVTYGLEGALVAGTKDGRLDESRLWFVPRQTEDDLARMHDGGMSGCGSAFTAGLTAHLVRAGAASGVTWDALMAACHHGLLCARQLLRDGFGPTLEPEPEAPKVQRLAPPAYPSGDGAKKLMTQPASGREGSLVSVAVPALRAGLSAADAEKHRSWRILDALRTQPMGVLAVDTLRRGLDEVFQDIPAGVFGKLATLDRIEIESLRTIQNLMLDYIRWPRPERPLCLAVFGQPGSGKSFGVKQVARSVASMVRDVEIEAVEFNLSQWTSPAELVEALHRVRDYAVRGKVPLVFFDEFDSALAGTKLYWLKSFLAPMQDGVFSDGHFSFLIGRAIFVFAGGTAHSFSEFRTAAAGAPSESKATDFLSRLRGHVDVLGFSSPAGTNMIRRAVVLRAALLKYHPGLFDAKGRLRIEEGLARAFLSVEAYRHGARSIEAIVDMSHLVGQRQFDAASLPPAAQLEHHVDARDFLALTGITHALGAALDTVARAIHEGFLAAELKKGRALGEKPSLEHWDTLGEVFRNSNREQAAHIPLKLAAVNCALAPWPEKGGAPFAFTDDEVERLARMEHDRWMEERRLVQPDHPDLKPWAELPAEEQEKDRGAVRLIPALLRAAGLAVVRRP